MFVDAQYKSVFLELLTAQALIFSLCSRYMNNEHEVLMT